MFVKTRVTAHGTEYWDNKKKRTLFVSNGEEPDFEVTENPESMIGEPGEVSKKSLEDMELIEMTITELKRYAEEKNIEIPSNIKKKDDLIEFIEEALTANEIL
ncbi:Rho termination factor N-terminal domain-containing protein [Heyndrickxia sp. FSL W8-0496]|uniref:Rho termination factor N-terminal domain-containing protein n=1 Tax=Heyndrickxia sp. FSL W8-0496 TaxID=2954702 RepID=UPI0030FCC9F8